MGHYDEQETAYGERLAAAEASTKRSVILDLESALKEAADLPSSREKAIAITHIETAILWLKK
jgi:hypothetical protein